MNRLSLAIRVPLVASIAALLLGVGATPAFAASSFQINWTHIGIYPRSAPSMAASKVGNALSDGTWISVQCETTGQSVTSDVATTTIWERLTNGTYLPNAFVETGANSWTPGVPRCDQQSTPPPPSQRYNRDAAAQWARAHYLDKTRYTNDCTWFVSQALWAGGVPQTTAWTSKSWDWNDQAQRAQFPGPSKAAANADYFKNALVNAGFATIREISYKDPSAGGARLGDIILYDWDGPANGIVDHAAIVSTLNVQGMVGVAQHSEARLQRPWSKKADGTLLIKANPKARVYLLQITY